ncbi:MAG TPA: hypothetical protein PLK90_01745 [Clostridiales bacterium]|nr:hypothetical protein [Clostridiales bacterium]HQP69098.1 hypothetical protein [Clostridiales bacterium]
MKKIFIFTLIIAVTLLIPDLYGQKKNWGIGLRLGDPSGISVKKYMGKNAWEFSIGRSHFFKNDRWYNDYYNDIYDDYDYYDRDNDPIGIQVHYLWTKPIRDLRGLDWYYGLGGQIVTDSYTVYYKDGDKEKITNFDLGADGVLGLEYNFADAPIALFGDLTLEMEVYDDFFELWFQPCIGARFNF